MYKRQDYEGTLRHAGFNNQGICDEAVYAKVRSAALDEEPEAVSYTHLDVYKRQLWSSFLQGFCTRIGMTKSTAYMKSAKMTVETA